MLRRKAWSSVTEKFLSAVSKPKGPVHSIATHLTLCVPTDAKSEKLLQERLASVTLPEDSSNDDKLALERLKDLVELRTLFFGSTSDTRRALRAFFALGASPDDETLRRVAEYVQAPDAMNAAMRTAELYWKLLDTASGRFPALKNFSRQLFEQVAGFSFDETLGRVFVARRTDALQREGGVPFLVLRLLSLGKLDAARILARRILHEEIDLDEDLRSAIYWLVELTWFTQSAERLQSFDETVRFLYHLCFTNPDRAGFLEIDSRFYAQFEAVSETAREGFLFKEALVEGLIELWRGYEGIFDEVFVGVLESLTRVKSKIYRDRASWERYWKREAEGFSADYLSVVEANLLFANGHYEDAATLYEQALQATPSLRSALLNSVFCYARLGWTDAHARSIERCLLTPSIASAALLVAGNSHLLIGEREAAKFYHERLRATFGWERKADYAISIFCHENGLRAEALEFAETAHRLNPSDSAIAYHLSVCCSAVGQKDRALDLVNRMSTGGTPGWLNYYRFQLERDAGKDTEAAKTLLSIPMETLEAEELEEAMAFARRQSDLILLRHLKGRI